MNPNIKVKDGFVPPEILELENYILEVLGPKHNQRDYEAWKSSMKNLTGIFGPKNNWPHDVTGIDHNLKDLKNHLDEFERKEAFAYSILSTDKKICIGCLYLTPINSTKYSVRADFWFTDKFKKNELEFLTWLKDWLQDFWNLENPCFPGRSISWENFYKEIENGK